MSDDARAPERVTFSRGYGVCIMSIDGTWRRDCLLNAISDTDAILTVEGSIQGLHLKEFFLLLSSTGLAYRRCELIRDQWRGDRCPVPARQEQRQEAKIGRRGGRDRQLKHRRVPTLKCE